MKWQFDAVQFRHDRLPVSHMIYWPKKPGLKMPERFHHAGLSDFPSREKVITSFLDNLFRDFTLAENCITSDNCIY